MFEGVIRQKENGPSSTSLPFFFFLLPSSPVVLLYCCVLYPVPGVADVVVFHFIHHAGCDLFFLLLFGVSIDVIDGDCTDTRTSPVLG